MEPHESSLVLPFAVIEREGGVAEEFPFDMTLATVLADVEMEREKAGMLRKREEGLEFTSLLYWPVVIAPWREGRHLVFDGMGVWSYVFSHGRIPDARSFASAMGTVKDWKSLKGLLSERATYFDTFPTFERVPVMGLFIHEEFMRDVLSHVALAKTRQVQGTPFLTPRLGVPQIMEAVKRMHEMAAAIRTDLETLSAAGMAVQRSLEYARKDLAALREATAAKFAKKIEDIRPDVTARVAALEKERDQRWASMQPKLVDLQGQVFKIEAEIAHWDAQARMRDNPMAGEAKEKRNAARRDWDAAKEQVQRQQADMARVREDYDRQVQAQWDRIRALERERDAEFARITQEDQGLVSLVGRLTSGMGGLAKQLEDALRFLESQGVPAGVEQATLVHMPIFVASFFGERGRRFVVYPPMVARAGKGVLGGLKSTFGGAVLPLEPKTRQFEEIFREGILKAVREDASLATYLGSVGNANNLLHLGNLRQMLGHGLSQLKAQGWIKDKHERELIVSLERHIAAASRTAPRPGP